MLDGAIYNWLFTYFAAFEHVILYSAEVNMWIVADTFLCIKAINTGYELSACKILIAREHVIVMGENAVLEDVHLLGFTDRGFILQRPASLTDRLSFFTNTPQAWHRLPAKMNRAAPTTTMADARRKGIYKIYYAYKNMGYGIVCRPGVHSSHQCDVCRDTNVSCSLVFNGRDVSFWLFAVHDTCVPDIVGIYPNGPAQMTLRGLAQIHCGFAIMGYTVAPLSYYNGGDCRVCASVPEESFSYCAGPYDDHCDHICVQCDRRLIGTMQQTTRNLQKAAVYKAWILGPLGDARIVIAQFLCGFLTEADVWEATADLLA
jgi:hypothetical protein